MTLYNAANCANSGSMSQLCGGNLEIYETLTSCHAVEHIFRVLLEFISCICCSNLIMYVCLKTLSPTFTVRFLYVSKLCFSFFYRKVAVSTDKKGIDTVPVGSFDVLLYTRFLCFLVKIYRF